MPVQENPTNLFVNLHVTDQLLILTDAEHLIYVFDLSTLQIIGKQMQISLLKAVHGEFGEILSLCKLNNEHIAFSASSNKLIIFNR